MPRLHGHHALASDGHALVVPKAPSRDILDAAPEDLQHLILIVQKVARAAKDAFNADGDDGLAIFGRPLADRWYFTPISMCCRAMTASICAHPGIKADAALLSEHAERLSPALARLA